MFGVKKKIRAVVGMRSLVGVSKKNFPLGHANYFSFGNDVRCLNMWAENLEEAVSRRTFLISVIYLSVFQCTLLENCV